MKVGRRGFMGTVAGILGALLVPVKAVASVFRPNVESDFIEAVADQEVLPGEVLTVAPSKGTRSWSIQVTRGRVRIRGARKPNGTGVALELLDSCYIVPTCGYNSNIFIENESESPAQIALLFQGRR